MRLQIRTKNFRLHDADRKEMERRLQFALGRFDGRISQVTVGLADLNGPRGGTDKQCRLVVRLAPSGKVTIEETHRQCVGRCCFGSRPGWPGCRSRTETAARCEAPS